MGGTIDTSAPGATASVELFGLGPGEGYRVAMSATSVDGETSCEGSTKFDVGAGEATSLMVTLHCKGAPVFGGVRVEGKLNVCAQLDKVVVAPLQTSQGSAVEVRAGGSDEDGDAVAYRWTATGGSFVDPDEAETTFTCREAAEEEIKIEVSDDDFEQCVDSWTVDVRCVDSGGAEPSWGTPILIETDNAGDARNPRVVVDPDGNVTVVWAQYDGARTDVYANRYPAGGPWGIPVRLSDGASGNASAHQVVVDPNGNVTVVWQQSDGAGTAVYTRGYPATGPWDSAVLLSDDLAGNASAPRVAVDRNGGLTVVWRQRDDAGTAIYAKRYPEEGRWGTGVPLNTGLEGEVRSPQLVVDLNGNVTAVWIQEWSPFWREGIAGNHYRAEGAWGSPVQIVAPPDDPFGSVAFQPQLLVDRTGNVTLTWLREQNRNLNLLTARYPAGGPWGAAIGLASRAFGPALAVDPGGNVMAVWNEISLARVQLALARFYPAGGPWAPEVRLSVELQTDRLQQAFGLSLAIDAGGTFTAVWSELNDDTNLTARIYAKRYPAGGPWGAPAIISDEGGEAFGAELATDPEGKVTAIWLQRNAVYANRYAATRTWGTPVLVSDGAGRAGSARVVADLAGNATAVWVQSDGSRTNIWSNRLE